MNATTLASRAVLSAYAKKALLPFEIIAMVIFVIALAGSAYLIASVSGWWSILLIVVIAYGLVGSILWLIVHFTIDKLRPKQTARQEQAVKQFIDRAGTIADTVGLTRFGLILRIVRDVVARKEDNVLTSFTRDSKGLKTDFENVIAAFRSR
jgi:hypothetical protein